MKGVLLKIMKGFTSQDMSSLSEPELAHSVRKYLNQGNYLLVFDDVWTVEAWNDIKNVLLQSKNMCKVLITSRYYTVGQHASTTKPHCLRFLSGDESWELLRLDVFGKLKSCPKYLEDSGKFIAKQCYGSSLAVLMIGGILRGYLSKPIGETIDAWEHVSRNISRHVMNNREQIESEMVAWSYNSLPHKLRDCFVYLGVFPEDFDIPIWTMARLWIAEGFIHEDENLSLEETAKKNLKELIHRNLVMVVATNPNGEIKACRLHHVIRAFCIMKGGAHNIFQEIKSTKDGVFQPNISFDLEKARRLSINLNLVRFLSEVPKCPGIRSFLSFYKEKFVMPNEQLSSIPDAFGLLKVLETKSFKFKHFPTKVSQLLHLRYLTLSCDELDIIPKAITELWNLQTLLVDTKSRKLEIQGDIWKMDHLRHLKTKASIVLAGEGIGKGGENLQTICRLSPEYCTENVFTKACNLKKLGVRGSLETLLSIEAPLEMLEHLENLTLTNDLESGALSENPLCRLATTFPPNLKRLTLSATYLDWKHMTTLGMIHNLQVLKLKNNAFSGDYWTMDSSGFTCIRYLMIATTDLVSWVISPGKQCFLNLRCLVLDNCKKLNGIPLDLAKSLQRLEITRVSKPTVASAKAIEKRKQEMQGHEIAGWDGFKLNIGPAENYA